VSTVGFLVHPSRAEASSVADGLVAHLRERGAAVRVYDGADTDDDARALAFARDLDLVVSVGGDGTFLRAAHLASRRGCPVLGVKVGRLGFLTEAEPASAARLLDGFLEGRVTIDERLALLATPSAASWSRPQWALNELIVEKRTRHRLVRLAISVDDRYVTTLAADGVIVATPTGSTAYSFSAGGPIVSPEVGCLVVTPIAAHMVFDRSFVVPATANVRLEVVGEEPGLLSADGRASLELPVGAGVAIARAPEPARFVQLPDAPGFHARLREKFGLPGDPVAPTD
jgi:NAD+ kinase